MTVSVLGVEGLRCARGGRVVVEGASFAVRAGEHVALTGENGSGKTTLLRCLLGLEAPVAGQVRLRGTAMAPGSAAVLRRVGWMPQRLPVGRFPFLVRELLASSGDPAAALERSRRLGVDGLLARPVAELSGGQLQRVFLARALGSLTAAGRVPLLVVDEPTAALDFAGQVEVAELLSSLETAALIVTHDEPLARRCDRCLALAGGRLGEAA
jgi:ABC-type Mn2+/Zn2+ transport system ATPase subunit